MNIRRVLKAGAAIQLARYALHRRRRRVLGRQRRRRALAGAALLGAGAVLWLAWQRRDQTPAWLRKKERKEARREAARREREQVPARAAPVQVERDAPRELKVPLGEQLE
jgi:hypothetical protein